jgi:4-carboxymuconolactone decarboxylase
MNNSERYQRGLRTLFALDEIGGQQFLERLESIVPDFVDRVVEFPFGDVLSRSGLDLKTRELITVAALTAMGTAPAQLRWHIRSAVNTGCARAELIEAMIQMAVYAGFPAALNGLYAAKEVFDEMDAGAEQTVKA